MRLPQHSTLTVHGAGGDQHDHKGVGTGGTSLSLSVQSITPQSQDLTTQVLSGLDAVDRVQNTISGRSAQRMQEELQSFLQEAANMEKNQLSVRSTRSDISEEGQNTIDRVSRTVGSVYGAKLANMLSLNIETQKQENVWISVDLRTLLTSCVSRECPWIRTIHILCYDEKGVITFCNSAARQIVCANAYSNVSIENSPVLSWFILPTWNVRVRKLFVRCSDCLRMMIRRNRNRTRTCHGPFVVPYRFVKWVCNPPNPQRVGSPSLCLRTCRAKRRNVCMYARCFRQHSPRFLVMN